ncbi:Ig-like domain-containing protein, partial [Variovorax sp. M-6]|uniref:Ig-like domain-containing protein n=1 Tax=Variovorax sp. M-6 TaxID=3233041 RepID=UPI003F9D571E
GSKVSVYDGAAKLGEVDVDGNGNWSFTPGKALDDGPHSFTTKVTDPAGNESASSTPVTVTVDTSKVEVSIGALVDDQGAITGNIAPNGVTDDTRPEIQGTGKAGSTITVYDGTNVLGTTTVQPNGTWSFTPTVDLGQGSHSITATATDKAGNVSDATSPFNFRVDTVAPMAPTIGAVTDDVGEVQGALANGGTTDDPSPTLSGKAEAGSTVTVYDGGKLLGSVKADANGDWSYTPTTPLNEGKHEFTVKATDAAGSTSAESDKFTLTTDYTPPDASKLAITGVEDDVGLVTGNVASGATTDDSRPLIHGTGTAGDTIIVMVKDGVGSRELGRATVGADGKWSLQVNAPLASGSNEFTAIEVDPAGNKTAPSDGYSITVSITPPAVPVIDNVLDDKGVVHNLQKGEVTDDDTPTIIGTSEPGTVIKIYDGSTLLGSVQADGSGKWSFTTDALADGAHNITATATNPVGQTSDATGIWNFVVDTKAPDAVSGLEVRDDVGAKQGPLSNGETTDDNRPTFSGKAEPGSKVSVYDGAAKLGEADVDGEGNWSFTPGKALDDGPHSFTTKVTDPAGNESASSTPVTVTVDTSKVEVSIGSLVDDQGAITGNIAPNGVTDDTRPEIKGTGKAGSTITVMDGTTVLGTTTVKLDGTWSFTPPGDLGQGVHSITATATDKAGNVSDATSPFNFRVDTVAPVAPTIGAVTDDVGEVQGALANGATTDDPSPTLSGKAEAGSTVTVYDGDKLLGSVKANANGDWSYTPTTGLNEGKHEFTVTATDAAGNTSAPSDKFTLTTDYTPPEAKDLAITGVEDDIGLVTGNVASGETTDDSRPLIHGTGTAGDTIIVTVKDVSGSRELGRVTVGADGKWSLQVQSPLASGLNEFTAVEMDPAGNKTAPSDGYAITVSITPPAVPVIDNIQDDVGVVHMLQKGEVTNDATPTLFGTAQAGNTVKIYDGATLLGEVKADPSGKWSFTPGVNLADGAHNLTATATNPVGQTSDATGVWNFVVDTKAPDAVSGLEVKDDVGAKQGPLVSGETTDDNRPTFSGKAEPG